jgi:CelD/BcsL family acetyltransferase involved in cellulose biosynthesis
VILRTVEEVVAAAEQWSRVPWTRETAELPYFLAQTETRRGVLHPWALFVDGGASAGWVERKRLPAKVGYLTVTAPRLRVLQLAAGGVVATEARAADALAAGLWNALRSGEADALQTSALPLDAPVFAALDRLGGPLERQRFVPAWERRRLVVPASFEVFLASRSKKVRFGIRYDGKRLEEALGDVSVAVYDKPEQLEELARDLDAVSRVTYQRALGMGFADTDEQRRLARLGLEHGWTRAYVLRTGERPVAYWLCALHRGTLLLRSTGYDPEFAQHRPGIYLLMRVIELSCSDQAVQVVDFGPGRSAYKRHFSSETYEERTVLLYAPSFRGRRAAAERNAVLGLSRAARWGVDRAGGTDRLKSAWRGRLRGRAA